MNALIANLPALIQLLVTIIQEIPLLAPAVQNFILVIKAELDKRPLTDAEKQQVDSQFDVIDAALAKADADRLALGDQEKTA